MRMPSIVCEFYAKDMYMEQRVESTALAELSSYCMQKRLRINRPSTRPLTHDIGSPLLRLYSLSRMMCGGIVPAIKYAAAAEIRMLPKHMRMDRQRVFALSEYLPVSGTA